MRLNSYKFFIVYMEASQIDKFGQQTKTTLRFAEILKSEEGEAIEQISQLNR